MRLPPRVALAKAAQFAGRAVARRARRRRDLRSVTFTTEGPSRLVRRLTVSAADMPASLAAALPDLTARYLDHRFDLLGSGWVEVDYGMAAQGVAGHRFPPGPGVAPDPEGERLAAHVSPANLKESRRLWRFVEGSYAPIDWQVDFKSGFRWDGRRHFSELSFGAVAGADVKVPWELARLQHLPQLAAAHLMAKAGRPGFREPAVYAREVRNQIADFLATNPPRFGVNWLCPMDVGIRVANMLLALDLLRAGGAVLDASFEAAVAKSAAAHARHILAHLEWSALPRSNHYLSNLAGVLFCALYLPADDETDAWLDFAAHALGIELDAQFLPDGGNVEGSTNYHRLSAEIGLFAGAALLGVAAERSRAFASAARHRLRVRPPLGRGPVAMTREPGGGSVPLAPQAIARLQAATACVAAWMKPNGRPPQIGDTNSGRLFKLHPAVAGAPDELHEDPLDHRALLSVGAALFDHPDPDWPSADTWFDGVVARALAGGRKLPAGAAAQVPTQHRDAAGLARLLADIRALPAGSKQEITLDLAGLSGRIEPRVFPDFGLIVVRDGAAYLSLRCVGAYPARATLGHFHDDNLALELYHDGGDLIADPGSYLYTPLAEMRDRYRSAPVHFAPRPEGRSAATVTSPFAMRINAVARLVHCAPDAIAAVLEGPGWKAFRAVLIAPGRVMIVDGCTPGALVAGTPVPVSEGYGRLSARMSFPADVVGAVTTG